MRISRRCAIKLNWPDVCIIITHEIKKILGVHMLCKAYVGDECFWNAVFINRRLSLPELCSLLQAVQLTPEEWIENFPEKGSMDIPDISMVLSEKLLSIHLKFIWEHSLSVPDGLWLIGIKKL